MREKTTWRDPDPSWPGADRRQPRLHNPAFLTLWLLCDAIQDFANQLSPPGAILDLGCGNAPYAPLFDSGLTYVSVDREKGYPVRMVTDLAQNLPFLDRSFDAVLCTQVLEHVRNPELIASEIHRVLKPGGIGFISVPFSWEIHCYPDDCQRFTPEGLRMLLRNFSVCDVKPLESSDVAWVQSKLIRLDRRHPSSRLVKFFIKHINRWMWKRRDRFQDTTHPGNLIVQLQK